MAVIFAGTSDNRSDQVPQVGLGPIEEAAQVVDEFAVLPAGGAAGRR
ncbi:hypothetical protein [Streptomyces puniciscabiei]